MLQLQFAFTKWLIFHRFINIFFIHKMKWTRPNVLLLISFYFPICQSTLWFECINNFQSNCFVLPLSLDIPIRNYTLQCTPYLCLLTFYQVIYFIEIVKEIHFSNMIFHFSFHSKWCQQINICHICLIYFSTVVFPSFKS